MRNISIKKAVCNYSFKFFPLNSYACIYNNSINYIDIITSIYYISILYISILVNIVYLHITSHILYLCYSFKTYYAENLECCGWGEQLPRYQQEYRGKRANILSLAQRIRGYKDRAFHTIKGTGEGKHQAEGTSS